MHKLRLGDVVRDDRAGGGDAAPGVVRFLALAAAPVFAAMAVWTYASGEPDMLCRSLNGASMGDGMGVMYALMSVFHAGPWLRLVGRG